MLQKKTAHDDIPIGAMLLRLRGAIQNLEDALEMKNKPLIVKRRIALNELHRKATDINYNQLTNSLVVYRILISIMEEVKIASSMLSDASAYLSEHLSIV